MEDGRSPRGACQRLSSPFRSQGAQGPDAPEALRVRTANLPVAGGAWQSGCKLCPEQATQQATVLVHGGQSAQAVEGEPFTGFSCRSLWTWIKLLCLGRGCWAPLANAGTWTSISPVSLSPSPRPHSQEVVHLNPGCLFLASSLDELMPIPTMPV